MTVHDLAILGGGPAGLGAAYRAAGRGLDVVLFEREDHVGGAAASIDVAGTRVDQGSHRLHRATAPDILRDLGHLLGDDLQERVRRGRIRLGGRWLDFPLRPLNALSSLPPSMTVRTIRDALTAPLREPSDDTVAEQVRARLGPTMLERFYGPYAEKLWGLAPDQIDGEQFRRRVSASSTSSLVGRVLRGAREPATFRYPRRGFGQISEVLAAGAERRGAELRLACPVVGLARREHGFAVHTDAGEVVARTVLSTLPVALLPRLVEHAPSAVRGRARSLESRAMTLVYLVLDVPRYTRYDAHYLPERVTPVSRISEPKNYRDSPDDPPDRTVLCAEIPCSAGDEIWSADEARLRSIVVAALADAGLPEQRVIETVVRRLASAYPVYRRGFQRHVGAVERWVAEHEGLVTLGRQGLFVHDNTHHALAMAYAAVDALGPDGRLDAQRWLAARERFREHVVED